MVAIEEAREGAGDFRDGAGEVLFIDRERMDRPEYSRG